jgi:hypothetical protein
MWTGNDVKIERGKMEKEEEEVVTNSRRLLSMV